VYLVFGRYEFEGTYLVGGRTSLRGAAELAREILAWRYDEVHVEQVPDHNFNAGEGRVVLSFDRFPYDSYEEVDYLDGIEVPGEEYDTLNCACGGPKAFRHTSGEHRNLYCGSRSINRRVHRAQKRGVRFINIRGNGI
jgi:hypothetical protein